MDGLHIIIYCAIFLMIEANVVPHAPHCTFNNKYYAIGEHIDKNPCEPCICTSSGRLVCAIMDCAPPMCVDAVHPKDQCCSTCPNGSNCLVGKTIIPAHQDYQLDAHTNCRCSEDFAYLFGPNGHQAVCKST